MVRHVVVIDLGKTNSKVALVDTSTGEEVDVIKQATASNVESLYLCLDHEGIEAFVIDSLRTLSKSYSIDAITVTTHGATAALLDASGALALPVVDYEFSDIDNLRAEYNKLRPPFCDTGSPALPGGVNVGAQLYWQQANFAQQFANARNDITSIACHTDLYEPYQKRYSTLVNQQGWQQLMPPIKYPGTLCGPLCSSMAKKTTLPKTTQVYTGVHDSNASLVPHLIAQSAPFSVVSTGTWFVAMAIGGTATQLDETRDTLINVNARGEPVPSAKFMGGRESELLACNETVSEQAMAHFLSKEIATTMLMPSVVTGTGPYPNAKQCWIDSGSDVSDVDRACATTLYLALMTQECLIQIGANGPTFVEGPLAHEHDFIEMLAAVTERPVKLGPSSTGTSVGAAMLISPEKTIIRSFKVKNALQRFDNWFVVTFTFHNISHVSPPLFHDRFKWQTIHCIIRCSTQNSKKAVSVFV